MPERPDDSTDTTIDGYDRLADDPPALDRLASPWADSPYQRHYVWPAVRPLLPDVPGLRVLDAGCGVGHYAERFHERGADVTGIDASERALAAARERCDDAVRLRRHDLTERLPFDDGAFGLVFCNLVLDHVADWEPVLSEFRRVLAPGGPVVVATIHPLRRYLNHREEFGGYHDTERYVVEWGDTDAEIASYYRPVGDVVESFVGAGLSISAFREPTPTAAFREHDPERYATASRRPDTLCVRAEAPR